MRNPYVRREADENLRGKGNELAAAWRWIRLGYKPIAIGETEIKRAFEFQGKCADFVFETRPNFGLVGDSKGKTIQNGVLQLENTIANVMSRFQSVEARILIHLGGDSKLGPAGIPETPVQDVGDGYTAVRQRFGGQSIFPTGEYILHDTHGKPKILKTGQIVVVEFW